MKTLFEIFKPLIYCTLSILCGCAAFGAFDDGVGSVNIWSWFQPSDADGEPGIKVLIIEDHGARASLPAAQQTIFTSGEVEDYLKTHAAKKASGSGVENRILDKSDDISLAPDWVRAAWALPRTGVPWVVILPVHGNAYSNPLPANVDDYMQLLKKYGGE